MDSTGLGQNPMAGSHEQYNEHSDFIKGGEFTDWLTDY
jgi:hypothetical protein